MRWRRIACLGCLLVFLVGLSFAFVFFDTLIDLFKVEFSESNYQPISNSTALTSPPVSSKISDLAYIQVLAVGYTDDADPEFEGISIDVGFYDSKSEMLSFTDIPLVMKIELYAYRSLLGIFDLNNADLVYDGSVSINHSMRLGELAGHYIRIPFEEIPVDQAKYQPFGTVRVIVSTPLQGEFEATEDFAPLFPYQSEQ